jgi:hypothetical protein
LDLAEHFRQLSEVGGDHRRAFDVDAGRGIRRPGPLAFGPLAECDEELGVSGQNCWDPQGATARVRSHKPIPCAHGVREGISYDDGMSRGGDIIG